MRRLQLFKINTYNVTGVYISTAWLPSPWYYLVERHARERGLSIASAVRAAIYKATAVLEEVDVRAALKRLSESPPHPNFKP